MNIAKEFKEFVVKGNIADLAVGVIIGAAFGKVVTSLVNDLIMPPIGKLSVERAQPLRDRLDPLTGLPSDI